MSSPIFLYTGSEIGEKEEAIQNLRKNAVKTYGEIDFYKYYWNDIQFSEVISQLQNENLFIPCTFVVLDGAEMLKTKNDLALLQSWIASPGQAILVLTTAENSVDKKLKDIVPKENQKTFWELFDDKKEEWLINFFRKNNYAITDDAVQSMLEMVENNTGALKSASAMIFSGFPKGSVITDENVQSVLASTREESPFTLFNAMADAENSPQARFEDSLAILNKLLYARSSSGIAIIAGLSYCFKQLRLWHSLVAKGEMPEKNGAFLNKNAQKRYRAASRIWNAFQTASVVALLADSDMKIRANGTALETLLLEKMLYEIVIKGGAQCGAYEEQIAI